MAMTVRDVMTKEVTTLKRNESLTLADDLMHLGQIRHLPVLDDDGEELIGIISQRDLFRGALAQAIGYGHHARRKLLNTLRGQGSDDDRPDHNDARHCARRCGARADGEKDRMSSCGQNNRLVGLLTEGDFVKLYARTAEK